jgi:hypothetical protein
MVVNPYRSSESSSVLPTVISGSSSKNSFLFRCLNTLSCGLLSRKITFYRLFIVLLLLTLALISYYFHLHFTHPTLLSGNVGIPPKYHQFISDPVIFPLKNAVPESVSDLFRLRRGKQEKLPLPEPVTGLNVHLNEGEVLKGVEKEKDPIAYNPDHFHRHREPLKLPKSVIAANMIKSLNSSFVPPPFTRSREKADFSLVQNDTVDLIDKSPPTVVNSTNSSTVSVPSFQRDDGKQNSKLKDELMKKLNAMKAGKAFSDSNEKKNLQNEGKSETGKHEEPIKETPPLSQQQQRGSESRLSSNDQPIKSLPLLPVMVNQTFDKPSYDLPPPLVERLKQTDVSSKSNANDRTTGKKMDYCSGQIDPFEKIPVDQFVPPKGAPFETVTVWKKKINEFLKSVSQLKIGGAALREKLASDVSELKILRFKLFCQYA